MQEVLICDVTMKQAKESSAYSLTFQEKLELAKLLDKLEVSVIELEGIEQAKVDSLRIKSIGMAVKNSIIAVPVQLNEESVQMTWNALKEAKKPRLQVVAPVSSVQMEYLYNKKPMAMLETDAAPFKAAAPLLTRWSLLPTTLPAPMRISFIELRRPLLRRGQRWFRFVTLPAQCCRMSLPASWTSFIRMCRSSVGFALVFHAAMPFPWRMPALLLLSVMVPVR